MGENTKYVDIANNQGDVIGTDFKGSGIIAGKEIDYRVQGNVINLNINASGLSQEVIDNLQKIISIPAQIEPQSIDKTFQSNKDLDAKVEESSTASLQIKNVLNDVNKIEKESGTNIEQIKIGDVQISKDELSLKELTLKGNEHFYKKQYNEAIDYYDNALRQDSNNLDLLFNKAYSLAELGKFNEAIKWYDKALRIKPDDVDALNNKGWALYNLGKYNEAIEYFDKALRIKPDYVDALNNKGVSLEKLGKYNEAIEWYDKALRIKPDYVDALNNKRLAQKKLGKEDKSFFSRFRKEKR